MSFVCARAQWGAAGQLGSVYSVCFQLLQLAVICHASSAHKPFYIHFRSQDWHVIKEWTFHCVSLVSYSILQGSQECCS